MNGNEQQKTTGEESETIEPVPKLRAPLLQQSLEAFADLRDGKADDYLHGPAVLRDAARADGAVVVLRS